MARWVVLLLVGLLVVSIQGAKQMLGTLHISVVCNVSIMLFQKCWSHPHQIMFLVVRISMIAIYGGEKERSGVEQLRGVLGVVCIVVQ